MVRCDWFVFEKRGHVDSQLKVGLLAPTLLLARAIWNTIDSENRTCDDLILIKDKERAARPHSREYFSIDALAS